MNTVSDIKYQDNFESNKYMLSYNLALICFRIFTCCDPMTYIYTIPLYIVSYFRARNPKEFFFYFYSCLLYIKTTPFPFLFYFILKAKIFRLRNFYIKLKTETKICTPANMSASGKAMWTSILFFLACFLPNALSEETKEHPSIGKEGFFKCVLLF